MGVCNLLYGALIGGIFANLFYPDVHVKLCENTLEPKIGLQFPVSFPTLTQYFQGINTTLNGHCDMNEVLRGVGDDLEPYHT